MVCRYPLTFRWKSKEPEIVFHQAIYDQLERSPDLVNHYTALLLSWWLYDCSGLGDDITSQSVTLSHALVYRVIDKVTVNAAGIKAISGGGRVNHLGNLARVLIAKLSVS